jgi:hypothetical protein
LPAHLHWGVGQCASRTEAVSGAWLFNSQPRIEFSLPLVAGRHVIPVWPAPAVWLGLELPARPKHLSAGHTEQDWVHSAHGLLLAVAGVRCAEFLGTHYHPEIMACRVRANNCVRLDARTRPLGDAVGAHALLLRSFSRLDDLSGMPVAEPQSLQEPKELAGTAGFQIAIKRAEPGLVARARVAGFKNNITPVAHASGNCMNMVRCHHRVKPVSDLADGSVLSLDLHGVGRDHRLELVRALGVASPHDFLTEYERRGFQPIVEPSQQAIFVINEGPMGAENLQHYYTERTLAGALLGARENDDDLGVPIWILYRPSEPAHEIPKFLLVAATDDLPDMPEQTPLLLPASARFNAEPAPQIILGRVRCAFRFKDDRSLVTPLVFLPEFFGADWFVCAVGGLNEDMANFQLELILFCKH